MASQRQKKLEDLFQLASDLGPQERPAFFERHCTDDAQLRVELEALLAQDDEGTRDYLRSPVLNADPDTADLLDPARRSPGSTVDLPSTRIGPYHILQKIGEGGMGVVYLAEQEEPFRRRVALKIVKPGMDMPRVLLRFERERQALAKMGHPGIARIFDAGSLENGRPFFVMEYIPGRPITKYCDRKRLSIRKRLQLFGQVCDAVHHAHQRGVVHRDLKPRNILVVEADGGAQPKVIDFGISCPPTQPPGPSGPPERRNEVLGSSLYMSPEQADPAGPGVDTRSDVYSLGVLLYELLAGAPPLDAAQLEGFSLGDIQRALARTDPPLPSDRAAANAHRIAELRATNARRLLRDLRNGLDGITLKAIAKDRSRRYASVSELAADVRRFLRWEPVAAGDASLPYRLARFTRRNRVGVLSACLVGLSLVAWGIIATRSMQRAQTDHRRALEVTRFLAQALSPAHLTPSLSAREDQLAVLENIADRLDRRSLEGFPKAEIQVRRAIGSAYQIMGELDLAERHLRSALATMQQSKQATSEEKYGILHALALVYLDSDNREAIDLFYISELSMVEAVLRDHPVLARDLEHLMDAVDGRSWEDLPPRLDQARNTASQTLAAGDPGWLLLADLLSAEGFFTVGLGTPSAAQPLLEEALSIRRRELPPSHLDLARDLDQLAAVLLQQGSYERAESLSTEALNIQRLQLRQDHWLIGRSRSLLGESLMGQGRLDEAEDHLVEGYRSVLGTRGLQTGATADCLSRLVRWSELVDRADDVRRYRALMAEAIAFSKNPRMRWCMQKDAFGPRYAPLVLAAGRFADLVGEDLRDRSENDQRGADLLQEWTDLATLRDRLLGPADPLRVVLARQCIQWALDLVFRYPDLLAALQDDALAVLAPLEERLPADMGMVLTGLAEVALKRGDAQRAQEYAEQALQVFHRSNGNQSTARRYCEMALVDSLREQGRHAEALSQAEETLGMCREWYGTSHQVTIDALTRVVDTHDAAGRPGDAAPQLELALHSQIQRGIPARSLISTVWMVVRRDVFAPDLYDLALQAARLCEADGRWKKRLPPTLAAALTRTGRPREACDLLEGWHTDRKRLAASAQAALALARADLGESDLANAALQDMRSHLAAAGPAQSWQRPWLCEEAERRLSAP